MRTLLIGVAAVGLTAAATASAQQRSTTENPSAQGSSSQSAATQSPSSQSSTSPSSASQTGTTGSASAELSGIVKEVDKDKGAVKISSAAGGEQELKIAPSATITRDGMQAGLDQLKEGDDVRASLDPTSNQATRLEVQSNQMTEKPQKGESKGDQDGKGKY